MAEDVLDVADRQVRTRSVVHAIGVVLAAFLAAAVLYSLVDQALVALGRGVEDDSLGGNVMATTLQYVGFLAVAAWYVAVVDEEEDLLDVDVPDLRDLGWIVAGLTTLFVASRVVSWVIRTVGVESAQNQVVTSGQRNPELFLVMIPITLLLVGPAEELLFRGVVQGLLDRAYGAVPGVVLASAFFGVAHYLALVGQGKATYLAVAAVLGLVLGTVYELSENVVVPAVVHGLFNTSVFVEQWLAAVGEVPALP